MRTICKYCNKKSIANLYEIKKTSNNQMVIALAGNPNTGKSTIFNALTGLKQHTGNWPGKTVTNTQGFFKRKDKEFILVDLPGTYSLLANSIEEIVARDFICFGNPDATIVVADATCLERNLNLLLQISEITNNVILCVNLLDEAKRKNIYIDLNKLSNELGIPVIGTIARNKTGLEDLMDTVYKVCMREIIPNPKPILYPPKIEEKLQELIPKIKPLVNNKFNPRWLALRILEGDKNILDKIYTNNTCKGVCDNGKACSNRF
ncbi:FeoB small GTPase domain-containing protein [Defluviitalea phaphyphila]|uniref:FeoB small GTPase domain-containing protein n=1 Tax=Defluviitalea phaphyphila TaxID=1473580 RepID=UPI000731CE7C|nr:FeoB small GTPase domain-containing protein [Defluviitalea phaphyphila]